MTMRMSFWRLLIFGILTVALISCGEDGLFGAATPTPELSISTPTVVALPPDASTAARIRTQGYLLVGVRYDDAPFGSVNDEAELVGFDVDLAREFALRWLGDPGAVRFVQVTNSSMDDRITNGQVNLVIGALSPHQGAARDIDYSVPYYYDGLSLAVRAPSTVTDTLSINGPHDLDAVAVGVVEGADVEAALFRATAGAVPQLVYYPNYYAAMTGLGNGVIGAVVGPRRTVERLSAGSSEFGLTPHFNREGYAIGVPKNDGPFLDLVNITLMGIINDGSYARLFERWFPGQTSPQLEHWSGTSRLGFAGLGDTLPSARATIQDIETRGYLVVGLVDDRLPFSDFDANGVARGFEADLVRTIGARWLGDVMAVQFVPHTEESGVAALQMGQVDLLVGGLPHTLPRDDDIDFSQTVYEGGTGLLVNAASGIDGVEGLNGGLVAVPRGGIFADVVQRAAAESGIAVSLQVVDDVNEALAGVAEGRYRAYVNWRSDLLNLAYTNAGFLVLDNRLTSRPIALGLRQNDAAFRDLVDLTLQDLAAEGHFAALYDDWFGTDPPFAVDIWPGAPYRSLKLSRLPAPAPTVAP